MWVCAASCALLTALASGATKNTFSFWMLGSLRRLTGRWSSRWLLHGARRRCAGQVQANALAALALRSGARREPWASTFNSCAFASHSNTAAMVAGVITAFAAASVCRACGPPHIARPAVAFAARRAATGDADGALPACWQMRIAALHRTAD